MLAYSLCNLLAIYVIQTTLNMRNQDSFAVNIIFAWCIITNCQCCLSCMLDAKYLMGIRTLICEPLSDHVWRESTFFLNVTQVWNLKSHYRQLNRTMLQIDSPPMKPSNISQWCHWKHWLGATQHAHIDKLEMAAFCCAGRCLFDFQQTGNYRWVEMAREYSKMHFLWKLFRRPTWKALGKPRVTEDTVLSRYSAQSNKECHSKGTF